MVTLTVAEIPSAAKSMKGEVVVSWITAAEMRPMTSAWGMFGRTTRIVMQKAEIMNSGEIMPPDIVEIALPRVKFRMKPAASRMASRTRALRSRASVDLAETVRACWVFSDIFGFLPLFPVGRRDCLTCYGLCFADCCRDTKKGPPVAREPF